MGSRAVPLGQETANSGTQHSTGLDRSGGPADTSQSHVLVPSSPRWTTTAAEVWEYPTRAGNPLRAGKRRKEAEMTKHTDTTRRVATGYGRGGLLQTRRPRIVRLSDVLEMTGLSRTTIWRRERDGSFPKSIRLGGPGTRAMGWREQDIHDWIDNLASAA